MKEEATLDSWCHCRTRSIMTTTHNIDSMISNLNDTMKVLADNLVTTQQKNIVIDVNEYNTTMNDTSLIVNARSRSAVKITGLLAIFTSNAVITIGNHVIPVPLAQSPFAIGGMTWVINADEVRKITQVAQGSMMLELFGEEYGDVGVM